MLILDRSADRIAVRVYPSPSPTAPAVVILPAMGVPAAYYRRFAEALHDAGLLVAVADLRGTGASTPPTSAGSAHGYAELVDDVAAVLHALAPQLTGRRRILLGHSLGGQLAVLHLALRPDTAVDALVLVAAGLPHWRNFRGTLRHGIRPFAHIMNATATIARFWPGWGFGGRQPRRVIRDWSHVVRTGHFPPINGTTPALESITRPVLAVSVDGDTLMPPPTVDDLCGRLTSAPVTRLHYDPSTSGAPMNHFTWVKAAAPLAARVASFAA
ncbi:alpha/beta hydrolase family protein [Catenuloplanes atrovinosus]|uniref:Alpha/beta hydrolase n=1 Tax=Catenuloplanes atrovinosus TaxID=137266 RepID=A0AAE4CBP6_9ACTN|nr:alpha/beta fold hydrolase [Catenuloplanes atrovinosus]MDR7278262.1 putative alpha/beta hydrolase [Catenuloplanes atrovinosus]